MTNLLDEVGTIWYDGKMMDGKNAVTHVLSHSLHYGSAVFEGERAYGGKVFALNEHSVRLKNSAKAVGYEIPYSAEDVARATRQVVAANDLSDAYVRPLAWRGVNRLGITATNTAIHLMIAAWKWPAYYDEEKRRMGIRLGIASNYRRPSPDCAPVQSKAAGLYMIATMARTQALEEGYDDALMLDYRGLVAEGTGANVFFVSNDTLTTPVPDCFLDGITRRTVIGLAKKRGIEVVERHVTEDELGKFDEAFLTGTAVEVTHVASIGEHRYRVGGLSLKLAEDYRNLTTDRITDEADR